METKVRVTTIYTCNIERAFKTPFLCDISKIHAGFGIVPKITHCTDDENWGQVFSSKKLYSAKSLTQKGGIFSSEKVLERIENKYWKIEVTDFKSPMFGFSKFTGEWKTTEIEKNKTLIEYTYTLHSATALLYSLNWLFAKTYWKTYMKKTLNNIKKMIDDKEPYLHN